AVASTCNLCVAAAANPPGGWSTGFSRSEASARLKSVLQPDSWKYCRTLCRWRSLFPCPGAHSLVSLTICLVDCQPLFVGLPPVAHAPPISRPGELPMPTTPDDPLRTTDRQPSEADPGLERPLDSASEPWPMTLETVAHVPSTDMEPAITEPARAAAVAVPGYE